MKITTKTFLTISALAGLSLTTAQAATVVWDNGPAGNVNESWNYAINWENDGPIPVSGQDSVELTERSVLNYDFTVASGQSIKDTSGANWFGLGNSGWADEPAHLTLATGGEIAVNTLSARGGVTAGSANAPTFTIQDGATLTTTTGAGGTRPMNLIWEAGLTSLTTWNTTDFTSDLSWLTVDLSNYNTAGVSSLTLVDYTGSNTGTFASVTVTDGLTTLVYGDDYTLDYTTDSNITLNLTTAAVPEPSSTALLGLGGLALILRRRK